MHDLLTRFEQLVVEKAELERRIKLLTDRQAQDTADQLRLYRRSRLLEIITTSCYYAPQERVWCIPDAALAAITDVPIRELANSLFEPKA